MNTRKNIFPRKIFLTPKARLAFIWLSQEFIDVSILHNFFSERYIYIKRDISGYAINRILGQLTSDQRFSDLIYNAGFLKSYSS